MDLPNTRRLLVVDKSRTTRNSVFSFENKACLYIYRLLFSIAIEDNFRCACVRYFTIFRSNFLIKWFIILSNPFLPLFSRLNLVYHWLTFVTLSVNKKHHVTVLTKLFLIFFPPRRVGQKWDKSAMETLSLGSGDQENQTLV